MTRTDAQPAHTINVLKLLVEHLPGRYRELNDELAKLRKREEAIRGELSKIEKHAAIEGIDLAPKPVLTIVPEPDHTTSDSDSAG